LFDIQATVALYATAIGSIAPCSQPWICGVTSTLRAVFGSAVEFEWIARRAIKSGTTPMGPVKLSAASLDVRTGALPVSARESVTT
jgi:hypothetical protein